VLELKAFIEFCD